MTDDPATIDDNAPPFPGRRMASWPGIGRIVRGLTLEMSPRWFRSISMTSRLPSTTSNVTFSTGMTHAVIDARPSLRQSSAHPQWIYDFRTVEG